MCWKASSAPREIKHGSEEERTSKYLRQGAINWDQLTFWLWTFLTAWGAFCVKAKVANNFIYSFFPYLHRREQLGRSNFAEWLCVRKCCWKCWSAFWPFFKLEKKFTLFTLENSCILLSHFHVIDSWKSVLFYEADLPNSAMLPPLKLHEYSHFRDKCTKLESSRSKIKSTPADNTNTINERMSIEQVVLCWLPCHQNHAEKQNYHRHFAWK